MGTWHATRTHKKPEVDFMVAIPIYQYFQPLCANPCRGRHINDLHTSSLVQLFHLNPLVVAGFHAPRPYMVASSQSSFPAMTAIISLRFSIGSFGHVADQGRQGLRFFAEHAQSRNGLARKPDDFPT